MKMSNKTRTPPKLWYRFFGGLSETKCAFRHSAKLILLKRRAFTSTVSGPPGCLCMFMYVYVMDIT